MQKKVAHLLCQRFSICIGLRVVPGINPIHHPKEAQHRDPGIKFYAQLELELIQQTTTNLVILALDRRDLRSETVLEHIILVREHLHRFLIGQKILQMVDDEDAHTCLWVLLFLKTLSQLSDDGSEGMFLD